MAADNFKFTSKLDAISCCCSYIQVYYPQVLCICYCCFNRLLLFLAALFSLLQLLLRLLQVGSFNFQYTNSHTVHISVQMCATAHYYFRLSALFQRCCFYFFAAVVAVSCGHRYIILNLHKINKLSMPDMRCVAVLRCCVPAADATTHHTTRYPN